MRRAESQRLAFTLLEVLAAVRDNKTTADVGGNLGTRECATWMAKRLDAG